MGIDPVACRMSRSEPAIAASTTAAQGERQDFPCQLSEGTYGRSDPEQAQVQDRDRADHQRNRDDMNHLDGREGPFRLMNEYGQRRGF